MSTNISVSPAERVQFQEALKHGVGANGHKAGVAEGSQGVRNEVGIAKEEHLVDLKAGEKSVENVEEMRKRLEKAMDTANKAMEPFDRRLNFSIHQGTGRSLVKVINTKTDEVIREIPSSKLLDMVSKMQDLMGLIVDERV